MRQWIVPLCLILLGGCGGGGGGGSDDDPPLPPPPPVNAPGPATLTYSGSTAARALDDFQAGLVADAASQAIQILRGTTLEIGIGNVPRDGQGIVRTTAAGPGGGTLEYTGRIQPNGHGWVQYDFTNFVSGTITVNGRQVREVSAGPAGYFQRTRVSAHGLSTSAGGLPATVLTYNLYVDEVSGTGAQRISGDLTIGIGSSPPNRKIEGARIDFGVTSSNLRSFEATARVYDSTAGYIDISTPAPVLYADNFAETPVAGGPLRMRGAANAAVEIQPLNSVNVALAIDVTGADAFERSVRLSSGALYHQQLNSGSGGLPVAILGANRIVAANDHVPRLEGRFSTHANGKFLTYSWRTIMAPPGGVVTIANPASPRPTTTFSEPGMYRFELTVSDGFNTSRDQVDLVISDPVHSTMQNKIAALAPPDRHLMVGEAFDFDAAPSAFVMPGDLSYEFGVSNENSQIQPVTVTGTVARFVPPAPGIYRMSLRVSSLSPQDQNTDSLWLYVDRSPLFGVPWEHELSPATSMSSLLAADVSGDGRIDLMETSTPPQGGVTPFTYELAIFRGTAGEAPLGARTVLSSAAGREIAAADLNGDGRRDLVTTSATGVKVFHQQANGTLGAPVEYGNGSGCDGFWQFDVLGLLIGDVNDDGRDDVVRLRSCGGDIEGFLQQTDGSLSGPTVLVPGLTAGVNRPRALTDFNSDGRADLIVDAGNGSFTLYRQQAGGGLAAGVPLDVGGSNSSSEAPVLCHGDVNNDGRIDLIAPAYKRVGVLLQTAGGELSAPSFINTEPPDPVLAGNPGECVVFDASGDGRADVFVQPIAQVPFLLLQDASGSLEAPLRDSRARAASGFNVRTLNAADINHDGGVDLLYGAPHQIFVQTGTD